jgi:hypothetical protein
VARDFGHEDVFHFLMDHSPDDVKLSRACQLGDEDLFLTMLASPTQHGCEPLQAGAARNR